MARQAASRHIPSLLSALLPSGEPWLSCVSRALRTTAASSSTGTGADNDVASLVQVVAFPKLSHQQQTGRLVKWLKQPGEAVQMYDIIMEVETEELVEEVFKVGDFAGTITLLVESQEEGYLADVLVTEGSSPIPVGTPVALFVESQEDIEAVAAAGGYRCPSTNVYDDTQPAVKVLPWQSFLKSASRQVKCMG